MRWTEEQLRAYESRGKTQQAAPPVQARVQIDKTGAEVRQNKTETEWHQILLARGYAWVGIQCITLRIADQCRYTPDHMTVSHDGTVTLWEVKGGHIWEDSTIKIKAAARAFPMFRFIRAQKRKGEWHEIAFRA